MDNIKHGCHKQKGEFDRLCNTRQHRSQSRRQQQSACNLSFFRARAGVHSECRTGEAENHQGEFTAHKAAGFHRKSRGVLGCKLGKKDVLRTVNHNTVNHCRSSNARLPKRQIEHVVQSERNENTLNKTVNQGSRIPRTQYEVAQSVNTCLHKRPQKEHHHTHKNIGNGGNNGHKSRAAKERNDCGKLNFIESVVQPRNAKTDDNTAKYTHLQGLNANHVGNRPLGHSPLGKLSADKKQCADGFVHDKKCNCRRKRCCGFFVLRHAKRYTHGK